jgi:hypothetical protein
MKGDKNELFDEISDNSLLNFLKKGNPLKAEAKSEDEKATFFKIHRKNENSEMKMQPNPKPKRQYVHRDTFVSKEQLINQARDLKIPITESRMKSMTKEQLKKLIAYRKDEKIGMS